MGAQQINEVSELTFTDTEESVMITLATGRTIELFGDGMIQEISVVVNETRNDVRVLETQI